MKKPMTSIEFARYLGVSQSTVSRAMNDSPLVPEKKRAFIRKKARQLGFALNTHAQSLRTNRTGTVGILFQKHFKSMNDNLMLAHIYDRIQHELTKSDYDVMTIYDNQGGDDGRAFERIVTNRKIDGLIMIRNELSEKEAALVKKHKFPCVSIFNPQKSREGLPCCVSDDDHAGYLAGWFLGRFKDYRPLSLGTLEGPIARKARNGGFVRGLKEWEIVPPDDIFHKCSISLSAAYDFASGLVPMLRKTRTAIFAHNDLLALGVMDAMKNYGIAVPDQVQVLGLDDLPLGAWMHPRLSTIHINLEEMVPAGWRILRSLIAGKKIVESQNVYKPWLALRETTLQVPELEGEAYLRPHPAE